MAFSVTFANDVLKLILHGTTIANIAINATSGPLTSFYAALHTAVPGNAQTDSEVTYAGYLRLLIARTSAGWTIVDNVANPVADVLFAAVASGGGEEATHWSIGTAASGTGKVLLRGPLAPSLLLTAGVQPRVTTASTLTLAV